MSKYTPDIKIYYGPIDSDHRIIPAPDISISLNYEYSNDTIIGYTYSITLTGAATALDLRALNYNDEITEPSQYNIGAVADHINKLRTILSQNGNILRIVKGSDDSHILKARGGILRSFNVEESPNNWIHYANYTATIDFQSVDFMDSTENCGDPFLDPTTYTAGSAGIVDIQQFKIKSFQDSIGITFDENESYNKFTTNELGENINVDNTSFNIEYTISAVGKHNYYFSTDDESKPYKLIPAWEQAKNFVQYRLYQQVTNLLNGVLKNSYTNTCSGGESLSNLHTPGGSAGLLKDLGNSNYIICNEQISCEASESEGSYSATYSAIARNKDGNTGWSSPLTKHSISKSIKLNTQINNTIKTINIEGTIEGLIEGGLIRSPVPITLPETGVILIFNGGTGLEKYNNASAILDKIFVTYSNKKDLTKAFKDAIGITNDELDSLCQQNDTSDQKPNAPHPSSFNLTHNYNAGTINYSAEYSNTPTSLSPSDDPNKKYTEISIQTTNPAALFASFNIPNSNSGPTIQKLNTQTTKNVVITVRGQDLSNVGQKVNLGNLLNSGSFDSPIPLPPLPADSIQTQKELNANPIDGTFTLTLGYICGTEGCSI